MFSRSLGLRHLCAALLRIVTVFRCFLGFPVSVPSGTASLASERLATEERDATGVQDNRERLRDRRNTAESVGRQQTSLHNVSSSFHNAYSSTGSEFPYFNEAAVACDDHVKKKYSTVTAARASDAILYNVRPVDRSSSTASNQSRTQAQTRCSPLDTSCKTANELVAVGHGESRFTKLRQLFCCASGRVNLSESPAEATADSHLNSIELTVGELYGQDEPIEPQFSATNDMHSADEVVPLSSAALEQWEKGHQDLVLNKFIMDKAGLQPSSSVLKMEEVRRTCSVNSDDISILSDGVYNGNRCDTAVAVCGSETHLWDLVSMQSALSNAVEESESQNRRATMVTNGWVEVRSGGKIKDKLLRLFGVRRLQTWLRQRRDSNSQRTSSVSVLSGTARGEQENGGQLSSNTGSFFADQIGTISNEPHVCHEATGSRVEVRNGGKLVGKVGSMFGKSCKESKETEFPIDDEKCQGVGENNKEGQEDFATGNDGNHYRNGISCSTKKSFGHSSYLVEPKEVSDELLRATRGMIADEENHPVTQLDYRKGGKKKRNESAVGHSDQKEWKNSDSSIGDSAGVKSHGNMRRYSLPASRVHPIANNLLPYHSTPDTSYDMSEQFNYMMEKKFLDRKLQPVGGYSKPPRRESSFKIGDREIWSGGSERSEDNDELEQVSLTRWSDASNLSIRGSVPVEKLPLAGSESVEIGDIKPYGNMPDRRHRPVGRRGNRRQHLRGLHPAASRPNIQCGFSASSLAGIRSANDKYRDHAKASHSSLYPPSEAAGGFSEVSRHKLIDRVDRPVERREKRRMTFPEPQIGVTLNTSDEEDPGPRPVKMAWNVKPNIDPSIHVSPPNEILFDSAVQEQRSRRKATLKDILPPKRQSYPLVERPRKPSLINRNHSDGTSTQRKVSGIIQLENSQPCCEEDRYRGMRRHMP